VVCTVLEQQVLVLLLALLLGLLLASDWLQLEQHRLHHHPLHHRSPQVREPLLSAELAISAAFPEGIPQASQIASQPQET